MCGIGGIVHFEGTQTGVAEKLLAMANAQKHRGPDGEGFVLFGGSIAEPASGEDTPNELKKLDGFVPISKAGKKYDGGFCHRRLSIIDLSIGGHQPTTNQDAKVWLTFNGEIYNYQDIKKRLVAAGHVFYSNSEAEVLLACWKVYGTRMAEYLDGMWAFALVDLEKQVFFASRDRIGVKPFYYHISNKTLVFASEVKGLQAAGILLKQNKEEVGNFIVFGTTPNAPSTFFENIYLLEPGHNLTARFSEGIIQKHVYFKSSFNQELGSFSSQNASELSAEIRSLLLAGVKSRLTSDVQVGVCLSGGLDSSAILGSVNHLLQKEALPMVGSQPSAFTVSFPGQTEDELELATTMAKLTSARHFTVSPDANGFLKQAEDLAYTMEMPFKGTNSYSAFKLFERIAQENIKVTLDGQGADELFAGYQRFGSVLLRQMVVEQRPWALWKELDATAFKTGKTHDWWLDWFRHKTQKWTLHQQFSEWKKPHLKYVNDEVKQAAFKTHAVKFQTNLNLALQDACTGHELAYMLLATDKLSMRFGVESRVPFSDYLPLIEKTGSIPAIYKWRNGRNKYLLYEAAKELVSKEIYESRVKKGFSTPFGSWMFDTHESWINYFSNDMNEYADVVGLKRNWPALKKSMAQKPEILWRIISVSLWKKAFKL